MFKFILLIALIIIYFNQDFVYGIQVELNFEGKCSQSEGFVTQDFDDWITKNNVTRIYLPMLSKLDALRITQSLHKKNDLSELTKHDIANACVTIHPSGNVFTFHGFCDKTFSKTLSMPEPKVLTSPATFEGGASSSLRVSLSDSETYSVMEVCWGDKQRSFAVLSSKPYLTPCEKRIIIAHLKAIGYNEDFFYGLHYPRCKHICAGKGAF